MKGKDMVFLVVFVLICSAKVFALQEGWPCLVHVHTNFSEDDGSMTIDEVVREAKKRGFFCIFFTAHGDTIKSQSLINDYINNGNTYNIKDGFVILMGREITVGNKTDKEGKIAGNDCHVNAFSKRSIQFFNGTIYSEDRLDNVLDILRKEEATFIWNHPWTCRQWETNVLKFSGIEIFNERFQHQLDMKLYLYAVSKGWHGFVVGGIDFHGFDTQKAWGFRNDFAKEVQLDLDITTFYFADSIDMDYFNITMMRRSTIATEGVKAVAAWPIPSLYETDLSKGPVDIRLEVDFSIAPPLDRLCYVYKNGQLKKRTFMTAANGRYQINYQVKEKGSYVFIIPGRMVTSPYWFKGAVPKKKK